MLKPHRIAALTLLLFGAMVAMAEAAFISPDPRGIQVSGGVVFVLDNDAADNEGAVGSSNGNVANVTQGNVTITYSNYWTTWGNVPGFTYGDVGAIMAVGPSQPGLITFAADPGYLVTIVSVDLIGAIELNNGSIPLLNVGSQSFTNVSFNSPTHNTLVVNETGATVVIEYENTDGDYGLEGLNNIVFTVALIPEPSSVALLALGGIGLALMRRRVTLT